MAKKVDQLYNELKNDYSSFLNFLKANYPIFHNSNFFYRDLQYGLRSYYEIKENKISYEESEILALKMASFLEEKGIFIRISEGTWKVNYDEFITKEPGDPFDLKEVKNKVEETENG